jgi:hypothetical protein
METPSSPTTKPAQKSSDKARANPAAPQTRRDKPQRDYSDSDVIHHVYFEDNDSFFPPSWLGQDGDQSQRRVSADSNISHGSADPRDEGQPYGPAEKEHLDWLRLTSSLTQPWKKPPPAQVPRWARPLG